MVTHCSCRPLRILWIACAYSAVVISFVAAGEIRITSGPSDTTVTEGQSVYMCCEYEGTFDLPSWRINRTAYLATDLPLNHTYTGKGLYIHKAKLSLSNTEYRCLFFARYGGRITTVESLPGILVVKSSDRYVVHETIVSCTSQTAYETTIVPTEQTEQTVTWLPVVLVCVLVGGTVVVGTTVIIALLLALLYKRLKISKYAMPTTIYSK